MYQHQHASASCYIARQTFLETREGLLGETIEALFHFSTFHTIVLVFTFCSKRLKFLRHCLLQLSFSSARVKKNLLGLKQRPRQQQATSQKPMYGFRRYREHTAPYGPSPSGKSYALSSHSPELPHQPAATAFRIQLRTNWCLEKCIIDLGFLYDGITSSLDREGEAMIRAAPK